MTPEERAAKKAFAVEAKIKKGTRAIRQVWVALAAHLHEFHAAKMWEDLDYENFEEWLGSPDIGLSRSHVYALVEAHEELVVKRGLQESVLSSLEVSKVAQVLPALRRGDVEVEAALSDCEALSRADLRAKYGKSLPAARKPLIECEQCGAMRQPHEV